MPDDVAVRTAARELGLRPKLLELAVQVGEVRTVRGAAVGDRRVRRAELDRLRGTADFPHGFRDRLHLVDAAKGAELLGVTSARFARLARGGCFSPARFYVNRYRSVVWLYFARDLRAFAERRAELLAGPLPRGLRVLLEEGVDFRSRHWRGRRVGQLCRQADGPWELAAARAAVLDAGTLEEAVPDSGERARLVALKPELMVIRSESDATRELSEELCVAAAEDEILWHRLMLEADLEDARVSREPVVPDACAAPPPGPVPIPVPGAGLAHARAVEGAVPGAGTVPGVSDEEPVRQVRCSGAEAAADRRRAHVLSKNRGPRLRPGWWRRSRDLSHPAF